MNDNNQKPSDSQGKNKFLNFPLCLISKLILEPETGLSMIRDYAVYKFSQRKEMHRSIEDALTQLLYVSHRSDDKPPKDIEAIFRELKWLDDENLFDKTGRFDADQVQEVIRDIALSERENDAIVTWDSERQAANFFGYPITNWEQWRDQMKALDSEAHNHEDKFGALVWTSLPADYLADLINDTPDQKELEIVRMVASVRSIVGRSHFSATTRPMLTVRAIGCKTLAVADSMMRENEALTLWSRKKFDRILTDTADRGFFVKFGCSRRRRIYVSTKARSLDELGDLILSKDKQHLRRKAEQSLRIRLEAGS